jgi:lipopolysaccharide export system ATP-binding protein
VRPTAGQIVLDGEDVTGLPMHQRARLGLGYLAQEPSVFRGLNVENNIRAVLELSEPDGDRRAASLEALLAEFEISHLRHSSASSLSGGERRRVEIARALAGRPSILLLDEPFAGVDPIAVGDIRALIIGLRERGLGILMTDHNARETLGVTDRAVLLHDGRVLAEGTPQAIIADERVRRSYLGEDFTL